MLGGKYHSVSVSANPTAGGNVSGGGGAYADGDSVLVTAVPNSGYNFVNWIENGIPVSTNENYSYHVGAADTTLVANFQNVPSITIANGVQFSVTVYNTCGTLTGTASPSYGSIIGSPSGNDGNDGNDTVISGTLSGLSSTPTDITLGNGTIRIQGIIPPSTTLFNASFY